MATIPHQRVRGRPAHPNGPTFLTYTPDGTKLITAGSNNVIRVYITGSDGEPTNIDDCNDNNTALAANNDLFIAGAEDGSVCVYSLETYLYEKMLTRSVASDISTEEPTLTKKYDGLIRRLESDDERSSKAIWHPDGRAFAIPTVTRDVQVVSQDDGEKQRAFSGGHMGDITALAWSPNGAMLATSASDRKIVLWDSRTQKTIARYDYSGVINIAWHPHNNIFSFVTSEGELFIYPNFLSAENWRIFQQPPQSAPFIHDPLSDTPGNARKTLVNGIVKPHTESRAERRGTPDSLDDILGPQSGGEEEDFVEDDDGAGYLEGINGHGKRSNGHLDGLDRPDVKRRTTYQTWQPEIHQAFQPGSTPWKGNRRYLCE
ncbi:MAG: hypothetical protein Q9185_006808 [Variospora sp. 1 TL-2023]